jgi:cytochrome P450
MSFFRNIFATIRAHAMLWITGLAAIFTLLKATWRALTGGKGSIRERLAPLLTQPSVQRAGFAVLRAFLPNVVLSKQLIKSYENSGTAFVTRASDVIEVLDREADFAVVYEPKMRAITGGENFFLGMQDSAEYQHDVSIMRLVMRREDVASVVAPLARREAETLAAAHPTRIDLPHDLTSRVPAAIVSEYFGTPGPNAKELISWATMMFWWLFADLQGDPKIEVRALEAARNLGKSVDAAIAARKASRQKKDDLIGRALALQAGSPEFTDLAIRNNLVGLVIGAIPTLSKAAVQAVEQLLARPEALAGARAAAQAGDEAKLGAYVFEALRFNPINPVIFRRANHDATIAASTLRARRIKKGTMVLASNLSAMFDPLKIDDPESFRIDRPWGDYILWGYGLHACFGAHINRAVLPAILRPVLARENLRRAPGAEGEIDGGDTPAFPQHYVLLSD